MAIADHPLAQLTELYGLSPTPHAVALITRRAAARRCPRRHEPNHAARRTVLGRASRCTA